jgi:uncharacterized protein YbjQ (UPF0145 family)
MKLVSASLLATVAALGLAAAAPASAGCVYPRAPDNLPDGATATTEQMVEGQKAVKQYMGEMDAYLNCLDLESDSQKASPDLKPEQKAEIEAMQAKKHNAAVDEMEQVAERFNAQIRAWKAKQKKD